MKKYLKPILIILILFGLLIISSIITAKQKGEEFDRSKILVISSIFPWSELARNIGADFVDSRVFLDPGADIHNFEPNIKDLQLARSSDLFLYSNDSLEPWLKTSIAKGLASKDLNALALIDSLDSSLLEREGDGEIDQHLWLDLSIMSELAELIANELISLRPELEEYFLDNLKNYQAELKELDDKYFKELANCQFRSFPFFGHQAFGYLTKRYNLDSLSAQGISPEAESSPQSLKALIDLINAESLNYIFSANFENLQVSQAIAKDLDLKIVLLHNLHNLSLAEEEAGLSYTNIMLDNLEKLKETLVCQE